MGMSAESTIGLNKVVVEDSEDAEVAWSVHPLGEGEVEAALEPVFVRPVFVGAADVRGVAEVRRVGFGDEQGGGWDVFGCEDDIRRGS